jgi:hypothetical protein
MTQRILLIVSGGIAAYKSLELVRILKRRGIAVRAVLTESAAKFVTPLSLGVLTEDHVYGDMFDLKEEREIGHIQLSRQADLIVVASDREHPGADGERDRGRSGDDHIAGDRQAGAGGTGDERADVASQGDTAEPGTAARRRHPYPGTR